MKTLTTIILTALITIGAVFGVIFTVATDGGIRAEDLVPDVEVSCDMADKWTSATEIILEETILEETILTENVIS